MFSWVGVYVFDNIQYGIANFFNVQTVAQVTINLKFFYSIYTLVFVVVDEDDGDDDGDDGLFCGIGDFITFHTTIIIRDSFLYCLFG